MLGTVLLMNLFWYKKERFKVEMGFLKKKNDLEFKKLAQEYGLPIKKSSEVSPVSSESRGVLGDILPEIIGKLPPETLADLVDRFLPRPDEGGEGEVSDMLLQFAQDNPEIVKSILGGIKLGTQNKQENSLSSQV